MADFLISPISTIHFRLFIILYDCNITTSVLHSIGRSGQCHNDNYFISFTCLTMYIYCST